MNHRIVWKTTLVYSVSSEYANTTEMGIQGIEQCAYLSHCEDEL
jgi:hypothetical protein